MKVYYVKFLTLYIKKLNYLTVDLMKYGSVQFSSVAQSCLTLWDKCFFQQSRMDVRVGL